MENIILAILTIGIGVGGCLLYFWGSNFILDMIFPARGQNAGRNINRANAIRPWLFIFPAVFFLTLYLVWPVIASFILSLRDKFGFNYVGFENYRWMVHDPGFWLAMRNNLLWFIIVPSAITFFGLITASLTDRLKWGNIAKSLIFMPMAISFIGASVIWKFIYEFRAADQEQIGLLNQIWLQFDGGPLSFFFLRIVPIFFIAVLLFVIVTAGWVLIRRAMMSGSTLLTRLFNITGGLLLIAMALYLLSIGYRVLMAQLPYGETQNWLANSPSNNFFLMVVLIWIQTGFAMVIFSAALRGIPEETVEAAVIDGANPFQIFMKIKVPQIVPTIMVVWTTNTILVLKVFDIVLAMTGGLRDTEVIANYMYSWMSTFSDQGRASALAIVIMVLVIPVMIWNIRTAVKED